MSDAPRGHEHLAELLLDQERAEAASRFLKSVAAHQLYITDFS